MKRSKKRFFIESGLNGVSEVGYTLNDRDQRTAVQYPGVNWNYGYDDKGQPTGAEKSAGDVSETYSYTYDGIGNRLTAQEGASLFSYTSNLLNQYTQVNTAQPTYDADGNMLTTGDGWTYAWNGENRLVRAEKDGTVVEMNYDYAGRRFEKKVYVNGEAGMPGTLQHHYKYVYDGYKLVELYDNDTLLVSFTWQPESVGGLDGKYDLCGEHLQLRDRRQQERDRAAGCRRLPGRGLHLRPVRSGVEHGRRSGRSQSLPLQQRVPRRRNRARVLQLSLLQSESGKMDQTRLY